MAASYVHWADRVQTEIGLGSLDLDLEALIQTETFAAGETQLQGLVEAALVGKVTAALVELAEARMDSFWATQKPAVRARWEVIADAGRVLLESARVESTLKGKSWSPETLISEYAYGDKPWCRMDTAQRHLERDFRRFEFDLQQHASLLKLVTRARQRYASVSDDLAERFTRAYFDGAFEVAGVLQQIDIYRQTVAPALQEAPTAYILVDALRFEMARELLDILEGAWTGDLAPALGTPPAVTEVGMAALLPGAEGGLTLLPAGGNKLAAVVAGKTLKTRQDRLDHLKSAVGGNIAVARLDQLAPLTNVHLREAIELAALIVVTATEEIDGLCENTPALARRMLDDVLNQLRRGIKTLFSLGVRTIVISADHGYLFGEKLTTGQGIDAPGGNTAMLKRRVWIGQGGADLPGVLRAPLSALGLGGNQELATPANLSCFKVRGGATEYFHGGLSLQELVIPVLVVRTSVAPVPPTGAPIKWELALGSAVISTRFLSVTVEGHTEDLMPIVPPIVRVEVRAGDETISVPVSAAYGFQDATKDVQLELEPGQPRMIAKNTIALAITEEREVDKVTVYLLDAATGISLARLEDVPMAIAL
ncbi:MAG: PglZ domain-containing protein, partial [Anaerolineae bacterium]|nr:PglZ domain-containing protein [Anaerolineae bacterium]